MKRELTLTDIAGYLDHPLLGQYPTGEICWIDVEFIAQHGIALAGYKPVLRPMSDLYAQITDRGYNDGKPFIPIFRMAKIKYPELTRFTHCDLDEYRVFASSLDSLITGWYEYNKDNLSIGEYDLLHRLHLDYRGLIDAGLAVSVHDLPTNPYEA
jgi:hypothetical protein